MNAPTITTDRRKEVRVESDDIIRWKRPGRIEDHKAWTINRSPSGFGFMTRFDVAPKIGDLIHIRRFDVDEWDCFDDAFRVARINQATDELAVIGCVVDESAVEA